PPVVRRETNGRYPRCEEATPTAATAIGARDHTGKPVAPDQLPQDEGAVCGPSRRDRGRMARATWIEARRSDGAGPRPPPCPPSRTPNLGPVRHDRKSRTGI